MCSGLCTLPIRVLLRKMNELNSELGVVHMGGHCCSRLRKQSAAEEGNRVPVLFLQLGSNTWFKPFPFRVLGVSPGGSAAMK